MLTPEEAKQRLAEFRVVGHEERLLARVQALPVRLGLIAQLLLEPNTGGVRWLGYAGAEERARLGEKLDELDPVERRQFFRAFAPKLADDIASTWNALVRQPYQWGGVRRGFRAPTEPGLTRSARATWLIDLLDVVSEYEQDALWFATWIEHAHGWRTCVGTLLACVVDAGGKRGEEVLDTLIATAEGRHEIAVLGRQAIHALAACSRPEAWTCLEQLLLRAQREEGLRQVIFEAVDLAHPECFRRMLLLIAEHDLARFSAVARAVDVWLGFGWDSQASKHVGSIAERLSRWISDEDARRAVFATDRAEDMYLALYAEALVDAVATVEYAQPLLRHPSAEVRYAALSLLAGLGHSHANWAIYEMLEDSDRRIAALAIDCFGHFAHCTPERPDLFEKLEAQLARWPPKPQTEKAILWPWCGHELDRARIGKALLEALGERPLARMRVHSTLLDSRTRADLCDRIRKSPGSATGDARAILMEFLGDASTTVRDDALEAIGTTQLAEGEELELEALLTRKAEALRVKLIELLLRLDDARVQASTERLLASRDERQRAAGLELLRRLGEAQRLVPWCRERAQAYAGSRAALSAVERTQLDAIARRAEELSLEDALGLSPVEKRTPLPEPRDLRVGFPTPAARALLAALDELVDQHAATSVQIASFDGGPAQEHAFGGLSAWQIHSQQRKGDVDPPLREVFEAFWKSRGANLRDADGLEGLRALSRSMLVGDPRNTPGLLQSLKSFFGVADESAEPRYRQICQAYLAWFLQREPPALARTFLLDAYETALARFVPGQSLESYFSPAPRDASAHWLSVVSHLTLEQWQETSADWSRAELERLWNCERLVFARAKDPRIHLQLWVDAVVQGIAREEDLFVVLLRPAPEKQPGFYSGSSVTGELRELSGQRLRKGVPVPARVLECMQRVRERLVEIELARGEAPTPSTRHCSALRWTGGLDVVARTSRALHGGNLRRGVVSYWSNAEAGREQALSGILRGTRPAEGETPELFAQELPLAEVGEARLLEIALFAPQWSAHAERALGWPGLAEAVWWMHAHTKDTGWSVDTELREAWAAQTSERTPLSSQDLLEGAVDVAWFERVRQQFGKARFEKLLKLAKYSSSGTGHTRARLFASALLGGVTSESLTARTTGKRNADSVRALGLVPLPEGEQAAQEVLARYLVVQEFLRSSRQFGAQRQLSEKRAAAIGLANLARTAGYADPIRLEWAMERAALGELAHGSMKANAGGIEVELAIDADGDARLLVRKQGKLLKKLPPAAKKIAEIKALVERSAGLSQQKRRMKLALETAMVRGDLIGGAELVQLLEHPVVAPLLARLVLVGGGACGYPAAGGRSLRGYEGVEVAIENGARLRIAHPLDLLATQAWSHWQRDCLRCEILQPFKQVFRELYVLTETEREERLRSRRYAGNQLQPRQAMALLGARGWVWHAEQGVRRVDHESGLAAWIEFLQAPYTPADVEGLTLECVAFTRRSEWDALPLETVPPRFFSEVMRDLDLVVSVANRSGVDPESSASSVELRAALVRETCALVKLANVRIDGRHAFIEGQLGRYSLHLGSGVVHKLPGGHLCIVPIHAQQRGRVFLPFADDDPKTAEILSKVLLLSRDGEIKDPSILEQIRR